jgi:MFS family permease
MPRAAPWHAAPGVLMLVTALAGMSQVMVIPVLGRIDRDLAASPAAVNWALIGGALAGAASTPLWGRLGDLVGHRRVLLLMLAALATGSLLTALASSPAVLIAGRAIAGLSASAHAVAIAAIRSTAPPETHARSIGAVAAGGGIGTGAGLFVGGLRDDWHTAFWIAFAVAIVLIPSALVVLPRVGGLAKATHERLRDLLDLPGAALLVIALVALLLPISQAASWRLASARSLALLGVSAVAFAVFVLVELRRRAPLVDLRLLGRRPVLLVNVASLVFGLCIQPSFLLFSGYVETSPRYGFGFGAGPLDAGAYLLPNAVLLVLAAPLAARAATRWGPAALLAAAALLVGGTYGALAAGHSQRWEYYAGAGAIGLAVALSLVAIFLQIARSVPAAQAGSAMSIAAVVQGIGSALGSALITALLTARVVSGTSISAPGAYTTSYIVLALCALPALFCAVLVRHAVAADQAAASRRGSFQPGRGKWQV